MTELFDDYALGLDIGTSTSSIGVFRKGGVEIIPNSIGEKMTPSIVTILEDKIVIGEEAAEFITKEIENSIYDIKNIIGRNYNDDYIKNNVKNWPFELINGENNSGVKFIIRRKGELVEYTPEEIISFIIQKMVKNAENFIGKKVEKLVITVPDYFNDNQRNKIKIAAELLNLEVLKIMNETSAIILAYGLENEQSNNISSEQDINMNESLSKSNNILIFDLGGGTLDISIIHTDPLENNTSFEVKESKEVIHLGGDDFDYKLCDYFIEVFCKKLDANEDNIKKNKKIMKKLKLSCEFIKKVLSKANSTVLNISNFFNQVDFIEKITRENFENLCTDLYEKIQKYIESTLNKVGLQSEVINEIFLVGGSSRMPKIKEILKNYFKDSKINDIINPEEAIVNGATLEAARILNQNVNFNSEINLLDIASSSLGVAIINKSIDPEISKLGNEMNVLIKRGTKIPTESIKYYSTSEDNQTNVFIKIYEGERKYIKDNRLLGNFTIGGLTEGLKGNVLVQVTFKLDENGILSVLGIENSGWRTKEMKIISDKLIINEEEINYLKEKNQKNDNIIFYNCENNTFSLKQVLKAYHEIYNNSLNNNENLEAKIAMQKYIKTLEGYVDSFEKNFDDERNFEKYYIYINSLFFAYVKFLNIEEKKDKNEEKRLIEKTMGYLSIFSNNSFGYLDKLIQIFQKLQKKAKKRFYEIVILSMELLNNNGKKCLKEMKKFCRYKSILYFELSYQLDKKYIPNLKVLSTCERKIFSLYKRLKLEIETYLNEINSDSIVLLKDSKKIGKLILGAGTGFTNAVRKHSTDLSQEEETYECILDNFERTLREIRIQESRDPSEEEAFVIANIIKIKWKILGKENYNTYAEMGGECERIAEAIGLDQNKDWYKEFKKLNEEAKKLAVTQNTNIKEIFDKCKKDDPDLFNEIDKKFENKNEFVSFILEKYPFKGYEGEEEKKYIEDINNCDKELLEYLSRKYHPDNYELTQDPQIQKNYVIIHYISQKLNSML